MKNKEIAKIFRNMATLLEIKGDLIFKIRAYERAALTLDNLDEDIEDIWKKGQLDDLAGIGDKLKAKIVEYVETGKIESYEQKKKKIPVDIEELDKVAGLGPKTILKLYRRFRVKNLKDLENAARQQKIRTIKGLGPVIEQNILKNLEFAKASGDRVPLGIALASAEKIVDELKKLKEINRISIAGSTRRMKETIGDIDILATSENPSKVMDYFVNMSKDILARGPTKSSVRIDGMQVDLRVIDDEVFGAGLLYFTGSQQHNIQLRRIAIQKGLKLSEYGLFAKKDGRLVACKTEEEVYRKLGLGYIEPEIREDEGEIEATKHNMLPKLVGYGDFKGDLQVHSQWSDGSSTIKDIALEAKRLGQEYVCVTDHVGKFAFANALDRKRVLEQREEIEKVNEEVEGIVVLQGAEVSISSDGSLDASDELLKDIGIVIAAVHSGFRGPERQMTKRMTKAMENEHVDILRHPTGRILGKRDSYDVDFDGILDAAKETGTVLEINANLKRMDLRDTHVRAAVKKGVRLSIGTDAHSIDQLRFCRLGIGTARRGWASKDDIINTRSLMDMMKLLK